MAFKNLTKQGAMKKPKNSEVEKEEVGLEELTPEEMKQVVAHFASLIRANSVKQSED